MNVKMWEMCKCEKCLLREYLTADLALYKGIGNVFLVKKIKFTETIFMAASPLDIEFSKYWVALTPVQKESILSVIKSFVSSTEEISVEQYNQELAEAEASYNAGNFITSDEMLQLIKKW